MAVQIDTGNRALSHANGGASIAGDQAAEEIEDIGVVADGQYPFAVGILRQHLLKVSVIGSGRQSRAYLDFCLVAQLSGDKLRRLKGALQGARDDYIHLHFECVHNAGHQHALVLALFDEGSLGVESGIVTSDSGVGVAHEVEVHGVGSGGRVICRSFRSSIFDFNTLLTLRRR